MKKLCAALSFFTRLPFWRLAQPNTEDYRRVVDLWSAAGLLTGGITALVALGALFLFPPVVAVIIAFAARLLLTCGLHEDGLADFFDGFGGGTSRQRILEIMKDSHIGSYGVLALIIYFLLLISTVSSIPEQIIPLAIFAADPWGKFCGSMLINALPYARKAEEAKNKLVYTRMSPGTFILSFIIGLLPSILLLFVIVKVSSISHPFLILISLLPPLLTSFAIIRYLHCKINGYTGDCCGASGLLCELAYYLTLLPLLLWMK